MSRRRCPTMIGMWSVCSKFCGCHSKVVRPDGGCDTGDGAPKYSALFLISRVFSRRPFLVLFLTLSLAGVLCKFGLSEYGFPEFEDPYLGFETRFTPIANRLISLENLKKEVNRLGLLENYPGEKLHGRETRKKRETEEIMDRDIYDEISVDDDEPILGGYCSTYPSDDYSRVALELRESDSKIGIFSHEVIMLVCYFQKLTEVVPEYTRSCERGLDEECCPMWSLPNYIAIHSNKTDCSSVKESDVDMFKEDMSFCRNVFGDANKLDACTLKHEFCPTKCHRDGPVYSTMFYALDKNYMVDKDVKFTMVILPVPKSKGSRVRTAALQKALVSITLPEKYVELAGYDFGDKDWTFKKYLVSDLQYVLMGSIVIFTINWAYTKSLCVTFISFTVLIMSLGISYFLYCAVFQIPFFPFMNMLVTIIVMGIGTDGTLILGSQWQRLKSKEAYFNKDIWDKMMLELLRETTAPLVVTTCTTAGAFFASLTSSITTIRCFSIFAGTSILIGFLLLYICVPTTLILSDLCTMYLKSIFSESTVDTQDPEMSVNNAKVSTKFIQIYEKLKAMFSFKISSQILELIDANRVMLWLWSFLVLLFVLLWSTIVVFYKPKFQLPNSEQFQLLSLNHPAEKFDREIEPNFPGGWSVNQPEEMKLTLYFVWGIDPKDTGYGLDPHDNGVLQFDSGFSMSNPKSQKWIRKVCTKLRKSPFYDEVSNSVSGAHYDSCFIDTMVKWMKRDCDHIFFKNVTYKPCCKISKFPYEPEVFQKCVGTAARDVYRTPSLYFQGDIAGPKFFVFKDDNTTDKNGQLATFSLRVKTNISFSLSYDKMRDFYSQVDTFYQNEILGSDKVPKGMENGFFVSAHLDFYDLQSSLLNDTWMSVLISAGLCFAFLWIFGKSFCIAVGAVLSIFSIVIVSSAILIQVFDWKLGVFESIAVTVAVGLSDFSAHHALEYSRRRSVLQMTSPTFFSALTTITIGLSMLLFSNVLVYQQIGAFFTVLIVVSWLYSVFFLSPVLDFFDKLIDLCSVCCRLCSIDRPTRNHTLRNVGTSIVFSNPMVNARRMVDRCMEETNTIDEGEIAARQGDNNVPARNSEEKGSAIIEKVRLLKKLAAETSV